MIREPKNLQNMKINVTLKDGNFFRNKDIPPQPFGNHERMVSFWLGDVLRSYPMSEVEYVEFVFGDDSAQNAT